MRSGTPAGSSTRDSATLIECPAVRAKPAVAPIAAGLALLAAGAAAASNGGATPVEPASPNAARIEDTFWVILGFTGFIFLLVETVLIVFIVRYRRGRRSRTQEGPQIRGHARLEL